MRSRETRLRSANEVESLKTGILALLDDHPDIVPGAPVTERWLYYQFGGPISAFRRALRELFHEGEIDHYGELVCRLPMRNGGRRPPPSTWSDGEQAALPTRGTCKPARRHSRTPGSAGMDKPGATP